jgi:hypothetical protein
MWSVGLLYTALYWWARGVPEHAVKQYDEGRSAWDVMSSRERHAAVVLISVVATMAFIAVVVYGFTRR